MPYLKKLARNAFLPVNVNIVKLITRPEESYRLCWVIVCDLETSSVGAPYIYDISSLRVNDLTLILLTWRKWTPNDASKWQMGFNSAFKGLMWYREIIAVLRCTHKTRRTHKTQKHTQPVHKLRNFPLPKYFIHKLVLELRTSGIVSLMEGRRFASWLKDQPSLLMWLLSVSPHNCRDISWE